VKKLFAVNVLVLAGLSVLGLGAIEAWLRLTVPSSSNDTIYAYTLDTKRYKVMKANAAMTAWGRELKTNELGFRDRAVAPKQPGEFRVVVLGDSFTVSAGVDQDRVFTSLMEKSRLDTRVINLGVGGYNIVQYALVLQEVGLALKPDLVLVALFPDNDFTSDTYEANYRVAAGQASAEPERAWYESLYAYRAYGTRLETKLNALLPKKSAPSRPSTSWRDNVAALKSIVALTRDRGIALEVVLLPHTWNFEKQRPLFARVHKECTSLGLACRDLLEPLIARGVVESSLRLNPLDAHPNERYNALVAEELVKLLPARGPLVRTGGPAR